MAATAAHALAEALLTVIVFCGGTLLIYAAQKLVQRVWQDLHPRN